MKNWFVIILGILCLALAAVWLKQRDDYLGMKDQRNALRQEVDDLKILRERDAKKFAAKEKAVAAQKAALNAELERTAEALSRAGISAKNAQAALRKAALRLNGMIFRGLEPSTGKQDHWQVLKISKVPDPETAPYKDCLVTLSLKAHPKVEWKAAIDTDSEQIVTGIAWGYKDRVLSDIAQLQTNDIVLCELIPEVDMDPRIRKLQLVDEVVDLSADPFYLANVSTPDLKGLTQRKLLPAKGALPSREESIAADLARINRLLEQHGGWAAWFQETRKYRDEIAAKMAAEAGPLNHENRIYVPTIEPFDQVPTQIAPTNQVATIVRLHELLAERNIDLIVAPVPTKEVVNAMHFLEDPPADGVVNPYRILLHHRLLEAGIEMVDLADPLIDALDEYPHVYYDALDSHPADGGVQTIAHTLAQRLARYQFTPAEENVWEMQTRYRVKAHYFEPRSSVGFPYVATRILHGDGTPVAEYGGDDSPVLILSDSFCGVPSHYGVWSANIPCHIYKEIGVLPQKFQRNMGGPGVMTTLAQVPDSAYPAKRVCLFVFGEFYDAYPDRIRAKWTVPN